MAHVRTFGNSRRRAGVSPLRLAVLLVTVAVAFASAWVLERRFDGLVVTQATVGETPVTLYHQAGDEARPLAVVAHGFGGSRQMMDHISVTLARSGFAVAAFDFPGHGRNAARMSPDVTTIDGTTAQLVETTLDVTDAMLAGSEAAGPVTFVGHSMATDVVIRAAEATSGVAGVAAISMYSEAVTPEFPQRLIVVSGAFEGHLRDVALDAVRQIAPEAGEGDTVSADEVERLAVVAPRVGHVGVLYSGTTLDAVAIWLSRAAGLTPGSADRTGPAVALLLVALTLAAWPLSKALPLSDARAERPDGLTFWAALALPILPAVAVAALVPATLGPSVGLLSLTFAFATWGAVQIAWLLWRGYGLAWPDGVGTAALLVWGLGVFALALDRYGAAFLPTGPRFSIMLLMLVGTIPLMLADAQVLARASLWRRIVARVPLILALATLMGLAPTEFGLTFTILPVLVLFFIVYGSFARWIARRRGPGGVGLAMGIALAWALAASTPLFATTGAG